jgi:hypothetical protein
MIVIFDPSYSPSCDRSPTILANVIMIVNYKYSHYNSETFIVQSTG